MLTLLGSHHWGSLWQWWKQSYFVLSLISTSSQSYTIAETIRYHKKHCVEEKWACVPKFICLKQISYTNQQCSIFHVWKELTLCHPPPVYLQTGETHCFWSWYGETIIICHPTLKSSHPKWHPSKWISNEDKSTFWEQPPVWKELRPCVSECVKEARRWRMDDTGLRVEEQQVVVRRMNSDWRSAQWQLNDLRSVDSVSINQTALSRFPPFLPLPLALISSFVSSP